MLNGLSLFSGIGGIDVALSEYVRPIAYCEREPYCQGVLFSRMASGELTKSPVWDDVTTLLGEELESRIDIIYGGFPCQDISLAGLGKGLAGERSGLFFEIVRLAKEIKPKFLFLENVSAITTRGGIEVVRQITEMGYDCRWCVISAASIGAVHKRERFFLLANSNNPRNSSPEFNNERQSETIKEWDNSQLELNRYGEDVADTNRQGCDKEQRGISFGLQETFSELANSHFKNGCDSNSEPGKQADSLTESEYDRRKTWGNDSGQCGPFESREHWQTLVSEMDKCSDGIRSRMVDIDLERCFVLIYTYAETHNESPREILSSVWKAIEEVAFQNRKAGTQADISKEEILQQFLRMFLQEFEYNRNIEEFLSSKSSKTPREYVRSMRNKHKATSASYRSQLQEQFARKHTNSLQNLSFLLAQNIESAWNEKCRQDAKDHVDQLRALGNAVVPMQVKEAFEFLMGIKK